MIKKGIGIDGDDNNNWELDYRYVINYFHTFRNPSVFNNIIDDVLIKLETQYQLKIANYEELNKGNNNEFDFSNIDTQLLEEQLKSLIEVKILYTFKECEILLKSIINIIYKGNNKELYKWQNLKSFYKEKVRKNITEVNGYKEYNEFREVNNFIKHSTSAKITGSKIDKIGEFKGSTYLKYENLKLFYKRVKTPCFVFIESIMHKMNDDYFYFSEEKLKNLSEQIKLRMNSETLKDFKELL